LNLEIKIEREVPELFMDFGFKHAAPHDWQGT
jgi:hypothetical protein